MSFGCIKTVYTLDGLNKRILDVIQSNLKQKNVNKIQVEDNIVSFRNNYIGKRSNISLMAGIDTGYFKLEEKGDSNELVVVFSIKRVLLFWLIISVALFVINFNNLIDALLISVFLSSTILVSVLRYKMFVKKMIEEFRIK